MLQVVRDSFKDLPPEVTDIILKSWRSSTHTQYASYIKQWIDFCKDQDNDPYRTNILCILSFLHQLFVNGKSYSTLNTARSALSAFVVLDDSNVNLGSHPLVSRFLKGTFNLKPPVPRYKQIWDARVVLNLLRSWGQAENLTLKKITLKLCILLALLGATRTQLLKALRVDKLEISKSKATFRVDDLMKTDRPGKATGHELSFSAYPVDIRLCVVDTLRHYLDLTQQLRNGNMQLFLSVKEPYSPVSKDTIARWIRQILAIAGIDVSVFKAHSVRSASVSAASAFVPVADIMNRAGWSQEKTFSTYYNKPINEINNRFENAILGLK